MTKRDPLGVRGCTPYVMVYIYLATYYARVCSNVNDFNDTKHIVESYITETKLSIAYVSKNCFYSTKFDHYVGFKLFCNKT